MKRLTLGIATVVMFGTLFSMATGYALWQVVQLNALLSLTPLPESPAPAVSEPERPAATSGAEQPESAAATEHAPRLAAGQNTPTKGMPADTQPIKQAVYVTVESGGAAVEVSVADKP
jgi:hypothetical protein